MRLVSIIIPTHRGSDKILLPVYGAMCQTYQNKEIIIVDDNGKGTEEQIKTQRNLQPLIDTGKIKYIAHEENKNGSAARNTGFRASSGEFVTFVDDDDYILPEKIEKQISLFDDGMGMAAVVCGTWFVHEDGRGTKSLPSWNADHIQRDYLCERMKFNTSAVLFRRKAIEAVGGFDESFRRHQDWELCVRIMAKYRFACYPEYLLIKYSTQRNTAANPQRGVEYYSHFSRKMKPYFDALPKSDSLKIYCYQSRRLLKSFLLSKDVRGAFQYAKTQNMNLMQVFLSVAELFAHVIQRFTKANIKMVEPMQYYTEKATRYFDEGHKEENV